MVPKVDCWKITSQRTVAASAFALEYSKPKELDIWLEETTPKTLPGLLRSVGQHVRDKLSLKLKHSVDTRTPCDKAILELRGARYIFILLPNLFENNIIEPKSEELINCIYIFLSLPNFIQHLCFFFIFTFIVTRTRSEGF